MLLSTSRLRRARRTSCHLFSGAFGGAGVGTPGSQPRCPQAHSFASRSQAIENRLVRPNQPTVGRGALIVLPGAPGLRSLPGTGSSALISPASTGQVAKSVSASGAVTTMRGPARIWRSGRRRTLQLHIPAVSRHAHGLAGSQEPHFLDWRPAHARGRARPWGRVLPQATRWKRRKPRLVAVVAWVMPAVLQDPMLTLCPQFTSNRVVRGASPRQRAHSHNADGFPVGLLLGGPCAVFEERTSPAPCTTVDHLGVD